MPDYTTIEGDRLRVFTGIDRQSASKSKLGWTLVNKRVRDLPGATTHRHGNLQSLLVGFRAA